MRTLSSGVVFSSELLWLLVDASECWGSRLKKSLWGSMPGTVKINLMRCKQVQAIPHAVLLEHNGKRVSNETYTALVLNLKNLLLEAREGLRSLNGSVYGNTREVAFASSTYPNPVSRIVTGHYQRSSPFTKSMSLDAMIADQGWPSSGSLAVELFKKMQRACAVTLSRACLSDLPRAFHMQSYQGLGKDALRVLMDQTFKSNSKHSMSRAHLSGSFECLKEIHRNRHALPLTSFRRAMSTSTEKQFDEDAGEQQSSVPSQQQSSLGGQQSSLEVPDSKPVGGPSWPNPDNAASYVLMSNIYADGDRWDEVKRINEMRLKARAWKKPGKAYVEIQAKVHEFIVGDRTHQDSTNIYEKLRKIKRHMGHIGYVPYVDLVLENKSFYDPYKPR